MNFDVERSSSFNTCCFTLGITNITTSETNVNITCALKYKDFGEALSFYKASFTNLIGQYYESSTKPKHLEHTSSFSYIHVDIPVDYKQNTNKSLVEIILLSSEGFKYRVKYRIKDGAPICLDCIFKEHMNEDAKLVYNQSLCMDEIDNHSSDNSEYTDDVKPINYIDDNVKKNIDKYINALKQERQHLINGGGKKYRATHGKQVAVSHGVYYYYFDIDAEIHLADDSPVRLSIGLDSFNGTVLLCEDFRIIICIAVDIGKDIPVAYINVEPWKLLDALISNVNKHVYEEPNEMVLRLINDGPILSTKDPITSIKTGQKTALEMMEANPITIVWGPPGTGKTHTMATKAISFIAKGKRVLIVSHSNVSVDGVAKKISQIIKESGNENVLKAGMVIRYGFIHDDKLRLDSNVSSIGRAIAKYPELKDSLEKYEKEWVIEKNKHGFHSQAAISLYEKIGSIKKKFKEAEKDCVRNARVVATTLSKVSIDKLFENSMYDVVMFDEISMANIPQVICAASHSKEHFIGVGDFMQLPPIAQSKAQETLCEDIFSYLKISRGIWTYNHPWLVMLNVQRRMHPDISKFASQNIYKNLLKDHSSTLEGKNHIVNASPMSGSPINIIDLTKTYCAAGKNSENSRFNILSGLISFSLAINMEQNVDSVSVITPYTAQTQLIRALILDYREKENTDVRCATVHKFQGSESDAVVFDAVESIPSKKVGWLLSKDFAEVKRLINVAATRARGKLVTVANVKFWEQNFADTGHMLFKLIKYLKSEGKVVCKDGDYEFKDFIESLSIKNGPEYFVDSNGYLDAFDDDIKRARTSIIMSLPAGDISNASQLYDSIMEARNRGVSIKVMCFNKAELPECWQKISVQSTNAVFPLVIIDNRITWYGTPYAGWHIQEGNLNLIPSCKVSCRVKGAYTAEIIKLLTSIEIETEIVEGKSLSGLGLYISQIRNCSHCSKPLKMIKGKSGKTVLWCSDCKSTELLTPGEIDDYLEIKHVRCPKCGSTLYPGVGYKGIYIKCSNGDFVDTFDI